MKYQICLGSLGCSIILDCLLFFFFLHIFFVKDIFAMYDLNCSEIHFHVFLILHKFDVVIIIGVATTNIGYNADRFQGQISKI